MAKFTYEVRVKNERGQLAAQFICTSLKTACDKAEAAVARLAGCTRSEVRQSKTGIWVKNYFSEACTLTGQGAVVAFIYKNPDGYDVLAIDNIVPAAERTTF